MSIETAQSLNLRIKLIRKTDQDHLPIIRCVDGYTVSAQANKWAYCEPKDLIGPYVSMELGYPNQHDDMLSEYQDDCDAAQTNTVFAYVPLEVIAELINKHGGFKTY